MSPARIRLVVAAVLFFGWLCWLGYLAFAKTRPVIVSRSQVMAADRFVLGEVTLDPATGAVQPTVTVKEDLRPVGPPLTGVLQVKNLEQAEIAGGDARFKDHGLYLLPLGPAPGGAPNTFELTRPPGRLYRAPGPTIRSEPGRPWAYAWDNPDVRKQFDELVPRR